MRGALDDAYELAVKTNTTLSDAAGLVAEEIGADAALARRVIDLADAADDLVSRIDNLRTALRGT